MNVTALTMLTRLALPAMMARRSGRILNVASIAAYQPGAPQEAVYYATNGASESALYKWMPAMSAAAVARAGYRGMMRGAGVVIPGAIAKAMAVAGELPPRRIALEVNRLLLKSASNAA